MQYVKHLFTATNQHGVHSPFVYDYVTQCLYKKIKLKGSKCESILLKSISYFEVEKLKIISQNLRIENRIQNEFGLKTTEEPSYDLLYFENPKKEILSIYKDKVHNNSIVLIANIHRTQTNLVIWEALKQNDMITVSINLFYVGVLFFRKEQAKQHFKIRI